MFAFSKYFGGRMLTVVIGLLDLACGCKQVERTEVPRIPLLEDIRIAHCAQVFCGPNTPEIPEFDLQPNDVKIIHKMLRNGTKIVTSKKMDGFTTLSFQMRDGSRSGASLYFESFPPNDETPILFRFTVRDGYYKIAEFAQLKEILEQAQHSSTVKQSRKE